jgi:hypothetical protein
MGCGVLCGKEFWFYLNTVKIVYLFRVLEFEKQQYILKATAIKVRVNRNKGRVFLRKQSHGKVEVALPASPYGNR